VSWISIKFHEIITYLILNEKLIYLSSFYHLPFLIYANLIIYIYFLFICVYKSFTQSDISTLLHTPYSCSFNLPTKAIELTEYIGGTQLVTSTDVNFS